MLPSAEKLGHFYKMFCPASPMSCPTCHVSQSVSLFSMFPKVSKTEHCFQPMFPRVSKRNTASYQCFPECPNGTLFPTVSQSLQTEHCFLPMFHRVDKQGCLVEQTKQCGSLPIILPRAEKLIIAVSWQCLVTFPKVYTLWELFLLPWYCRCMLFIVNIVHTNVLPYFWELLN